jgi:hypothetical protein
MMMYHPGSQTAFEQRHINTCMIAGHSDRLLHPLFPHNLFLLHTSDSLVHSFPLIQPIILLPPFLFFSHTFKFPSTSFSADPVVAYASPSFQSLSFFSFDYS